MKRRGKHAVGCGFSGERREGRGSRVGWQERCVLLLGLVAVFLVFLFLFLS